MSVEFERDRTDDYLTRLAASDLGRAYKAMALREMGVEPGHRVLDVGCGPGADLRGFAGAVGPAGTVTGLDTDEAAVEQARRLVADLPNVAVRTADAHAIDLPDGGVDRAHTDRVLQHVADPGRAIAEIHRVLGPAGLAIFAEPDWDTLAVDYPDPRVPVAYRRFITDRAVRNARVGRELPRLAQAAGFTVTRVVPVTAVFREAGAADRILGFRRVTDRAVDAGYLSTGDAGRWLAYLASGPVFASVTLFVVVAQR